MHQEVQHPARGKQGKDRAPSDDDEEAVAQELNVTRKVTEQETRWDHEEKRCRGVDDD